MTITVHHRVERLDLGLGLVHVEGIRVGPSPAALAEELERWIARRHEAPLSPEEDQLLGDDQNGLDGDTEEKPTP